MPMPTGIGVVDLMLQIPTDDPTTMYEFLKPLLLDRESRERFKFPAEYMFKDVPTTRKSSDYVGIALDEMDKVGIAKAMIGVDAGNKESQRALREHPDRFFGSFQVNPNAGMDGVRDLVRAYETLGNQGRDRVPCRATARRSRSTTRSSTRSTQNASSSTSRSASAPACPGRGCRWGPRTSPSSTRCAGSSPS